MASPDLKRCLIRANRASAGTGAYDWAIVGENGSIHDSDSSQLRPAPGGSLCELIVAGELVLLDEITLSAAQRRRIASSLRFLVEDNSIVDSDQLHVAAAPATTRNVLNTAIVDRQWMAQVLVRFERQGLVLRAAYPECLLPDLPERGWTVVWNGEQSFARTGDCDGFALDLPEEGEVPVALRLALAKARGRSSMPERILVRPAPDATAPALDRWTAVLGVPAEEGPAWNWASGWRRPSLDLLQGEFAARASEARWSTSLRRSALLGAAIALVLFCGISADWLWKIRERDRLTTEMQETFRATFGEKAVVVDAPLQMSRALTRLQRQAGQIGPDDFLALLGAVSEKWLDPTRVRVQSVVYNGGALTLAVRPAEAAQFSALLGELRGKPPAPGLEVRIEPAQSSGTITLRVAPGAAPK